jgi:dTDP-4-amino-4,6-dideoxygalactose transaminase
MILCANPSAQYHSYQTEIEQAIRRVLEGGRYILGPELEALEQEFAAYVSSGYAIGVANGTDALELALRGLNVGSGDEVITVSHTAVATVAAIEAAGAIPVLVDVDPEFYTLDPGQLSSVLTSRTRAVIAVHLYGQPSDLDAIGRFCIENGLALIEDVSQAHGARWKGKRLGSIGQVSCFSCYPTKNLGAIGDAGLVTTNDETLAQKIMMLREYGWKKRYISELPGRNSRLDELQAAVLRIKLRHLDADNEKRRKIAGHYANLLTNKSIHTPKIREGVEHVFHLYVVRTQRRQEIIDQLKRNDIYPGVHYPEPVHLQPAYKGRVRTARSMKVTEKLSREVLSLPMYPELSFEMVERVTNVLKESLGLGKEVTG